MEHNSGFKIDDIMSEQLNLAVNADGLSICI